MSIVAHFRDALCLFQNESSCKTIHMEMYPPTGFIFRAKFIYFHMKDFTRTRFETEAQGNSAMAFCKIKQLAKSPNLFGWKRLSKRQNFGKRSNSLLINPPLENQPNHHGHLIYMSLNMTSNYCYIPLSSTNSDVYK